MVRVSSHNSIELDTFTQPSESRSVLNPNPTEDVEPLLQSPSRALTQEGSSISEIVAAGVFNLLPLNLQYCFIDTMEEIKHSKAATLLAKLQTSSEPGLTNAQLMLTNHDLKPVEPERRQWGAWNFVGFWIADSFNIVSSRSSMAQHI